MVDAASCGGDSVTGVWDTIFYHGLCSALLLKAPHILKLSIIINICIPF